MDPPPEGSPKADCGVALWGSSEQSVDWRYGGGWFCEDGWTVDLPGLMAMAVWWVCGLKEIAGFSEELGSTEGGKEFGSEEDGCGDEVRWVTMGLCLGVCHLGFCGL